MPKIIPHSDSSTVVVKTKTDSKKEMPGEWWNASTKKELTEQILGTVSFLKDVNQFRMRQSAIYSRMYNNMPITGWLGTNLNRVNTSTVLPLDRPTMNVVSSCIDTLISRLTQSRPRAVFLTDNGDYKKRTLAKQMDQFIDGEFYQTKIYELAPMILRDACILGTGTLKILEDQKNRVCLERRLSTELLVDFNDAYYGSPRQLYEMKLMDRRVLASMLPKHKSDIEKAQQAYPDTSSEAMKTVSDLIMIVEGWHLPSGPDANDGLHVIVCTEGIIFEEKYEKENFPFIQFNYSPPVIGYWGQGLCEQLMGTQAEINKILITISKSINLVGVPRVFIEEGSKIVKAHLNNEIGSIITFRGQPPQYTVAPCVPAEMYEQLQRLITYAYQQCGISTLSAASQKPAGLTSGTALREYDDLQSDRFAYLSKRYEQMFIELAYQIIDLAKDIAIRDGKYQTIYPNKDGVREIDLPDAKSLDDPFEIKCYDSSSLPKDPAGRLQTVTEMMQAGIITPSEGRRMLDYPDTDQIDRLANAGEERITQILDDIVQEGKYTPPDPFINIDLAIQYVTQYYNLYVSKKLEEEKVQLLLNFHSQVLTLKQQSMPQPMAPMPTGQMANPPPLPQSDLLSNVKPSA